MTRHKRKNPVAARGLWTPISLEFLNSAVCASLSPHASKLLLDVHAQFGPNASRNGDICLAPKVMFRRGWKSRATLNATVKELVAAGILIQTRQGSRLDCSLFACTLYPLDCDLSKLDVRPGSYRTTDYMNGKPALAKPPTEKTPAQWNQPRKTTTVAPSGNKLTDTVSPRNKINTARAA